MMGDGEAPIVGEGQPAVTATTSALGDVPVATEWAPAREPAAESARPQPTLAYASTIANDAAEPAAALLSIPTLISSVPGAQAGLKYWPPRALELEYTRPVVRAYSDDDDYGAMYRDENVVSHDTRNVVCHPMSGDRREFIAFHPPVSSPVMPDVFDRPLAFRPIRRGHGRMSRDFSRSRDSRQQSHGSSRATSRMSGANFDWVGDFMKKFADDASSRERRLVEEALQREKDLRVGGGAREGNSG